MASSAGWVVHRSIPPVTQAFLSYAIAACVASNMATDASGELGVVFSLNLYLGNDWLIHVGRLWLGGFSAKNHNCTSLFKASYNHGAFKVVIETNL